MGLVLDFGATVLDGSVTLPVAFSGGTSGVLSFVARADAPGTGRTARNPLRVYSDRIRVGTSEAACLEAEWGASIDDVGLVDDTGVTLYIQFRRLPGDGSVALTDSLGMISTGFVVLTNTARGVAVSYGTGSAAQLAPASAHGRSVSVGAATAEAVVPPAIGGGASVSYGSAAAAQIAPTPADTTSPTLGGSLSATPGTTSVALDWNDATDNVGVDGYDVQYKLTSSGTWLDWSPDPTTSALTVTGLTANTSYDFRVRAHDAAGNTSSWLSVTVSTLTIVLVSDGFASISGWSYYRPGATGAHAGHAHVLVNTGTRVAGTAKLEKEAVGTNELILPYKGSPANANYKVSAKFYYPTVPDTAAPAWIVGGIVGRMTAQDTYYLAHLDIAGAAPGTRTLMLYKVVGGTYTQLGSSYTGTITAGDVITLSMNGTSIAVLQNGTSRITATDGGITAAGVAGLRSYTTIATGAADSDFDFDDFTVEML